MEKEQSEKVKVASLPSSESEDSSSEEDEEQKSE